MAVVRPQPRMNIHSKSGLILGQPGGVARAEARFGGRAPLPGTFVALVVLALLTVGFRPVSPRVTAHQELQTGSQLSVAQQVGPLALVLTVETPPRLPGPLMVDVLVEEPAVAATLFLALVPRDASIPTDVAVRIVVEAVDHGPYLAEIDLPGPGDWELVLRVEAEAAAGVARVPLAVVPAARPVAPLVAAGALAIAGALLLTGMAVVGIGVRRGLPPPRWLLWSVSHGLVACLVVAAATALQAVLAPANGRPLVADTARPHVNLLLQPEPSTLRAGEPVTLGFLLVDGATGRPVDDLVPHHQALVHAVLIGDDGSTFAHLHPARVGRGRFQITVVPDRPGPYTFYTEVTRRDGSTQVVSRPLIVAGRASPATELPPAGGSRAIGGLDVTTQVVGVDSDRIRAGEPTTLRFTVSRAGHPVADLQPWLAMPGHLFVWSEDGESFAHVHALGPMAPSPDDRTLRFGPEIAFAYVFPKSGAYRLWFQFKRDNRVLTLPLRLEVSREEG